MNIQRWIARREVNWKTLDRLLRQVEKKGLKSLSAQEIQQLASLYRSVSGDFARAKTYKLGKTLSQNLQQLTSRGYSQIYQGSRRQEWQAVTEFYLWGLPQVIQETRIYIMIATAMFVLWGVIGWWYAWSDPVFISLTVPQQLIETVRDRGELWMGSIVGVEPLASSGIMINNLSVSFAAIAGGISGGIYSIYLMGFNGLHIGTVSALVAQNNLSYPFWSFVFPHGALELPAIFLAGGAGILIGQAILLPGQYTRMDALKKNGQKAVLLLFGIVPMLVIAGAIEGFFSPNPVIPDSVKYITGIGLLALFIAYCSRKKPSI